MIGNVRGSLRKNGIVIYGLKLAKPVTKQTVAQAVRIGGTMGFGVEIRDRIFWSSFER